MHVSKSVTCDVILATAKIRVISPDGRSSIFRALIDQGSQSSFITQRAVKCLRVKREPYNVTVVGIGGNEAEQINSFVTLDIRGTHENSPLFHLRALVMNRLTGHIPHIPPHVFQMPHIKNLTLADNELTTAQPIDLLLGAEVFSLILKSGVKIGNQNEPVAQETTLGWIISGRVLNQFNDNSVSSMHVRCVTQLDKTLRAFWEIEEVRSVTHLSRAEQEAETFFEETTTRRADGRYIVKIPFKQRPPDLGDTHQAAFQCYLKLQGRLARNPEVKKMYDDFLQDYLDRGHMAPESSFSDKPQQRYFLPHHPVLRASSTTTKLRVVFNASAKSSNGNSLNDCMHIGPKLQSELFDVLLRWRIPKYVISGDMEKMFRQIEIAQEDTPFLCIYWQPPNSDQILVFRLKTVTYGTAAAPYLSIRVLHQLADDEKNRFPNASAALKRDVYVDDGLFGHDSIEECRDLRDEIIQLLRSGGFSLRKFESNCEELINDIPSELRARDLKKTFDSNHSTKVLGIQWNSQTDCFSFQVQPQQKETVTKRIILSCIASIFDPLGWVAPTVVKAKIFMQNLWRQELDWDTELSDSLKETWLEIKSDFVNLTKISIPRWTRTFLSNPNWKLFGFSDASEKAYGAVVYLFSEGESGNRVSLLASKTRVAPVKELSIPRLELCAAVLLSELMSRVHETLNVPNIEKICWSDSTIVLSWIKSDPSRWKKFVANRVSQIHENIFSDNWNYVPTKENPADLASRGVSAAELQSNDLWWQGPSWLASPPSLWPTFPSPKIDETKLEARVQSFAAFKVPSSSPDEIIARFSSWRKLLSVTAIAYQWLAKSRKTTPTPIRLHLIDKARKYWIKNIQQTLFSEEFSLLSKGRVVAKGPLSSLDPFLDDDKIIRILGRLKNSELPFEIRCPIVLGPHPLTRLYVQSVHAATLHGGCQLMYRCIREKYWLVGMRNLVRSCIRKCVPCVKQRGQTGSQKMGDLPADRINSGRVFSRVGVDYAGPFSTRASSGRGRATTKGYIVVFVCLTYRAVSLGYVSDYTSKTFLACFKRFVGTYGLPNLVRSDNAKNFQGAEKELRTTFEALQKDPDVSSYVENEGVDWRFIAPQNPHEGGIWEAGVKSVKHHLRRVINTQILTFEEMTTLLAQIQACLNSRPMAPASDRPDDFSYLTPGHFICGGAPMTVPEIDLSDKDARYLSRWQRVQHMRTQYNRIWRSDVLLNLQQRRKWKTSAANLQIGDIVTIKNDDLPPGKWELGRVLEIFKGKDGLVRVVKVKTAKSTYNRSIHKLCLLPLRHADSKELYGD